MQKLLAAPLLLLVLGASAQAHDIRRPDGTPFYHDCQDDYFAAAEMRNVSVTVPQVHDCEGATWPDIPASCVADEPTLTASAE